MNYLEQLAAEYYEYIGYFVRTNIKARKLSAGGWGAELDVLALLPSTNELIHLEISGDADAWANRKKRFLKKFDITDQEYQQIIGCNISQIRRIAVAGWTRTTKIDRIWENNIEVLLIPEFIKQIITKLHGHEFVSEAVPEGLPLLRTIQMMDNYQDLMEKKKL
jgi:hypothetical protein